MITREWSGQIEPDVLTRLERFTYLTQVTLGTHSSKPFLVRGVTARELHAEHYTEQPPEQTADGAGRRRAIGEVLKRVDGHDERIARWLDEHKPTRERHSEGRSHTSPGGGTRVLQSGSAGRRPK